MCRFVSFWLLVFSVGLWEISASQGGTIAEFQNPSAVPSSRRLPGEFERQDAVLLSWDSEDDAIRKSHLQIVRAAHRAVRVLILVSTAEDLEDAMQLLTAAQIPSSAIRYIPVPYDTIWARDYGPSSVTAAGGGIELIDADYERGERPNDDQVPAAVAPVLRIPAVAAPLTIEGGNLLSNGAGLCITTRTVLDQNAPRGYTESEVAGLIRDHYGAREVLFLEPLEGEPTGHVDMFATFTSVNTVVVGAYSPADDPVNAAVLNRNARRLAQVVTPQGLLKVVRVPMPPRDDDVWRTYTNVLYANDRVLVPTYPGVDEDGRLRSLSVFRQLLPGWQVVDIDCNELIELGGAVHCITLNLAGVSDFPFAIPANLPRLQLDFDESPDFNGSDDEDPDFVRTFGLGRSDGPILHIEDIFEHHPRVERGSRRRGGNLRKSPFRPR